jgi:hypothetical protein
LAALGVDIDVVWVVGWLEVETSVPGDLFGGAPVAVVVACCGGFPVLESTKNKGPLIAGAKLQMCCDARLKKRDDTVPVKDNQLPGRNAGLVSASA